jgi:hypothetical protein
MVNIEGCKDTSLRTDGRGRQCLVGMAMLASQGVLPSILGSGCRVSPLSRFHHCIHKELSLFLERLLSRGKKSMYSIEKSERIEE